MRYILLIVCMISFFSCKENPPVVPSAPDFDTSRKILVEEFTGVGCVQCPSGSEELENLLGSFGNNLVVVSIHAGDFVNPLPESNVDFKTDDGENLLNYLGAPFFYPSAVVNRRDYDGGVYLLQYGKDEWAGFINEELQKEAKITVNISKTYDTDNRELQVQVSGIAQEELVGDLRMTIMISESNIVDAQLDQAQGGLVLDYVHKHAMRTILTKFDGDSFATRLAAEENYDLTYTTTIPENWKAENCEIIAFVNLVDGQNKEILQVEEAHVED